ncbi:hypothetical protein BRADI_5g11941v3 [Brachypodium distachyon]|uniref:Uncharacterized protein n=1 Tax=Brachypodium distachyon TaxID=15368 RepID=A0A2K2CGP6_BRADI|nr:hypothetical protein BRADI_5g11941v3 [Brachypodium distachyon]
MEALLELEKVQRVLSFMGSRGLSDSAGGGDGDRFLAHFLLFLVQPFDSLSMEKKVAMVSELLKEINALSNAADQDISSGDLLRQTKNFKTHTEKLTIQDVPMIGFDAMMRANSTLEDFLDASNEDSLHFVPGENSSTVLEMKKEVSSEISLSDKLDSLDNLLQCQGLMTDQLGTFSSMHLLRNELKSGIQYWSLERKLCQALLRNDKDDVINNTFNILRMFAAIYGSLDAPKMLAKCIGEAEEKYESFSKKLDPSISRSYWRRCEEATKEGSSHGTKLTNQIGMTAWTIQLASWLVINKRYINPRRDG